MSTANQRDRGKEQYWRRIMRQWQRSGLSGRGFCLQRGLSEPSFYGWRRTLSERDAQHFVPVEVRLEPASALAEAQAVAGLELELGAGRRLRIGPGFDAATLQRLLPLLEEGQA